MKDAFLSGFKDELEKIAADIEKEAGKKYKSPRRGVKLPMTRSLYVQKKLR